MMTSIMRIMVRKPASPAMTVMPPYSPAEALFKRLMKKPCAAPSFAVRQAMPMPMLTTKYPRPMGMPSRRPRLKTRCFMFRLRSQ